MNTVMQLYGRPVRVELSKAATRTCARFTSPLYVEMELHFGCLVTRHTHFRDAATGTSAAQLDTHLYLDFRATATGACNSGRKGSDPVRAAEPVANIRPYVPGWCRIDYAGSQWSCESGYDRSQSGIN